MKGLLESRHTSSERRAWLIEPSGRASRTGFTRLTAAIGKHDHGSGPLTYLVMPLCELAVSSSSDRIGARVIQRTTILR